MHILIQDSCLRTYAYLIYLPKAIRRNQRCQLQMKQACNLPNTLIATWGFLCQRMLRSGIRLPTPSWPGTCTGTPYPSHNRTLQQLPGLSGCKIDCLRWVLCRHEPQTLKSASNPNFNPNAESVNVPEERLVNFRDIVHHVILQGKDHLIFSHRNLQLSLHDISCTGKYRLAKKGSHHSSENNATEQSDELRWYPFHPTSFTSFFTHPSFTHPFLSLPTWRSFICDTIFFVTTFFEFDCHYEPLYSHPLTVTPTSRSPSYSWTRPRRTTFLEWNAIRGNNTSSQVPHEKSVVKVVGTGKEKILTVLIVYLISSF